MRSVALLCALAVACHAPRPTGAPTTPATPVPMKAAKPMTIEPKAEPAPAPAMPVLFDAEAAEMLAVQCRTMVEPEKKAELLVGCAVIYTPDGSALMVAQGSVPITDGMVDVEAVEHVAAGLLQEVLAPLHKPSKLEI